jgi:hypothetical protein
LERETKLALERDGKTNSWTKVDGIGFSSPKSNYFKKKNE